MLEIIIGILAGIFTGLGMGGGSVLILFLTLFLNLEQHIAQATNLLFFIPSALVCIILNTKKKLINFKNAIFCSIWSNRSCLWSSSIKEYASYRTAKIFWSISIIYKCI